MKLRSRARRVAVIIKREKCSFEPNASSKARLLVPDATLNVKQDSESCTLVKQEQSFASALINSNIHVEPNEETNKAIKQEETSKPKIALGRYVVGTCQGRID